MDLKQRKLTKSEWDGIEIPVHKSEQEILRLIVDGFSNVHLKVNKTDSIFTHLKIEYNTQIEEFLYAKFFADKIKSLIETYSISFIRFGPNPNLRRTKSQDAPLDETGDYYINIGTIVKLNSSDKIRLSRLDADSINNDTNMYEFILFNNLEQMVKLKHASQPKWVYYYYTLSKLLKNNVDKVNKFLKEIIATFIKKYEGDVNLLHIVHNSCEFIEKNPNILKYSDLTLYDHQKEIYTAIKSPKPKLVLYIAPTGTGKTLTPLGLSQQYKVIFVCAARHVGLALARSAISIGKRIAFAFGCSAAEDVRLHYFAAKECTRDKRTGQIRKVDNTVGDKVEIIICDIRSYLPAMFYMASFNPINSIVTYWDEPTITMDYQNHELHKVIKKNWKQNIIPNFVLSSATLPKMHELTQTIADFREKFPDANINNIVSHDCRKTIPLINNNGYVVMPHYLHEDYAKILETVSHCEDNMTLLRYFDLKEASEFIYYVETNNLNKASSKFERNFASVDDIDMKSIKLYYLKMLKNIIPSNWSRVYNHFRIERTKRIKFNNTVDTKGNAITRSTSVASALPSRQGEPLSRVTSVQTPAANPDTDPPGSCGVYVTTKDAYTLTDGPTIFLANDLAKIAKFCIQQANIPAVVMKDINEKIEYNNQINERIDQIEKELEFEETKLASKLAGSSADTSKEAKKLMGKKDGKGKSKIANKIVDKTEDRKIAKMREDITTLKSMGKNASLDDMFIPNRILHLEKWANGLNTTGAFTSDIEESIIVSIMLLKDVDDSWKILLLLGIGVFTEHRSSAYTEIMKKLADQQKLYLIIADSDYIYGTNYQFCHGYLSKDLELTQEKIIQALGRIGRNNIQQEYSARFRDDTQVTTLFTRFASEDKPEVINMNQLFNCKNIKWNGVEYEELPDEQIDTLFEDDDEENEEVEEEVLENADDDEDEETEVGDNKDDEEEE
jgi:hypothetical protein